MPSFKNRAQSIRKWVGVFGERDHRTITSIEIQRHAEAWFTSGPKMVREKGAWIPKPIPLSANSVNLHLRALENMWTVKYPKEENIVRRVDEYGGAIEARPRGQTFALCYEVLAHMPDVGESIKGAVRESGSMSRTRFEVSFLTGLEPKQLARLKEIDINWTVPSIKLPPRAKGQSMKRRKRPRRIVRERPLLEAAIPALRRLFELGANKPFSLSAYRTAIRAGVKSANTDRATERRPLLPTDLRPKDWTRHTFGTEIYRQTHDIKIVSEYLGHSDMKLAEIYAEAALHEHMIAAAAKLSTAARAASGQKAGRSTFARWRQAVRGKTRGKKTRPFAGSIERSRATGIAKKAQ